MTEPPSRKKIFDFTDEQWQGIGRKPKPHTVIPRYLDPRGPSEKPMSSRITWTPEERDAIVASAVQYARGRVTTKLQALTLGMKSALVNQSRHRNCVSVTHFGPYISEEFDRRMHETEKVGTPMPKIGRTASGAELPAAVQPEPPTPEPAQALEPLPPVLGEGEDLVLKFPDIVIPSWMLNVIAAQVEARVMSRVMAIMQAAQGQQSHVTPEADTPHPEGATFPEEEPPRREPSVVGDTLNVLVIGLMPQRKQWLLSAIPARLRSRLAIDFQMSFSGVPQGEFIIIQATMSEVSQLTDSRLEGRYYRTGVNPNSVLTAVVKAADFHLTKMDQE